MAIGIGDASKITGVPTRKIRYWEDKEIIYSMGEEEQVNRKYNYYALKGIILVNELIEEGYTLDKASEKVNTRIKTIDHLYKAMEKGSNYSSEDTQHK